MSFVTSSVAFMVFKRRKHLYWRLEIQRLFVTTPWHYQTVAEQLSSADPPAVFNHPSTRYQTLFTGITARICHCQRRPTQSNDEKLSNGVARLFHVFVATRGCQVMSSHARSRNAHTEVKKLLNKQVSYAVTPPVGHPVGSHVAVFVSSLALQFVIF